MKEVYLDIKIYPSYDINPFNPPSEETKTIQLTDKEYDLVIKAEKKMQKAQTLLSKKWNNN